MFFTIYKTVNIKNSKFYIGKHATNNLKDGYLGSGKAIKEAIKKYGRDSFTKEILFIFETEEEMNQKEKEILTEEFISDKNNYNKGVGGEGGAHFKGRKHSQETKDKISKKVKGYKHTPETKKKVSEANKGRKFSEESRRKLSETTKRRMTDEVRKKISETLKLKGRTMTDEVRKKISEAAKLREKRKKLLRDL